MFDRLFELEPRTKTVFGFTKDHVPTGEEVEKRGLLIHAIRMIHMFDAALSMLGPDTETLCEILNDLGKRHIGYGVKPHYFPFMGHAVLYALQETLGDKWTPQMHDAWVEIFDILSGEIMKSILNGYDN
jgi:hemoglobin-like flavoprotein